MVISLKFRGGLRGTVNLPFHAEMCFRFRTYFANEITRETGNENTICHSVITSE